MRPSTALTVSERSIVMPSSVAPLWVTLMPVPTESSPASQCASRNSRHAISKSRTSSGVA